LNVVGPLVPTGAQFAVAMIRFIRPTIPLPETWLPYVREAYENRWFSNGGPLARRFEKALIRKFDIRDREAVMLSNCTDGLCATLLALGIRGNVVIPAFTFPATAHAALRAGCQIRLCDVSKETWELDPDALRRILQTENISAVIHVRAFGLCRDIAEIEEIARRFGVPLVVDAAAALGGRTDRGEYVGSQGVAEVFSLHATKVFAVGEGGVVIAHADLASRIRTVANFGLFRNNVVMPGFNAKCSEFHAAIGLAVLDCIDGFIERRREVAAVYRSFLDELCGWASPVSTGMPPWQTYPALLPADIDVAKFVAQAELQDLELRRYYTPALHKTTLFCQNGGRLLNSSDLAARMLCLPVYSDMTSHEADQVLDVLRRLLP
jgi:dTDP-4-amino-4,6-dideoxygalactose transaminase